MAYSEYLADRIRNYLMEKSVESVEKKMMGGLTFMVKGKMCVGIVNEDLMARIDHAVYEESLKKPGCREMDFTGKPMKGYVFVSPEAIDDHVQLMYWVDLALVFNKKARASPRRKK